MTALAADVRAQRQPAETWSCHFSGTGIPNHRHRLTSFLKQVNLNQAIRPSSLDSFASLNAQPGSDTTQSLHSRP